MISESCFKCCDKLPNYRRVGSFFAGNVSSNEMRVFWYRCFALKRFTELHYLGCIFFQCKTSLVRCGLKHESNLLMHAYIFSNIPPAMLNCMQCQFSICSSFKRLYKTWIFLLQLVRRKTNSEIGRFAWQILLSC